MTYIPRRTIDIYWRHSHLVGITPGAYVTKDTYCVYPKCCYGAHCICGTIPDTVGKDIYVRLDIPICSLLVGDRTIPHAVTHIKTKNCFKSKMNNLMNICYFRNPRSASRRNLTNEYQIATDIYANYTISVGVTLESNSSQR
eukprot:sb/3474155/